MKAVSIFLFVSFLSACSTPPEKIRAKQISPLKYEYYSCEAISDELFIVKHKIFELTMQQRRRVEDDDTAAEIVFGFQFLGLLFSPFILAGLGDDNKKELSQLKGEYEALKSMAEQKECNLVLDTIAVYVALRFVEAFAG